MMSASVSGIRERVCVLVRREFSEIQKPLFPDTFIIKPTYEKRRLSNIAAWFKAAAQQIARSGLHVSEARAREYFRQHLPNFGREGLFKQALREAKLEMGLIK